MSAKIVFLAGALLIATLLNGCATAVVAGAGAAAGYVAHQEGYRVRNPVTNSGGSEKKTRTETDEDAKQQ
jgi:hypothetical protein